MGWTIAVSVLAILAVLLFAPVGARVRYRRESGPSVSVHWLGVRLYRWDPLHQPKRKPKKKPSKAKPGRRRAGFSVRRLWRMGRAGYAAVQTEGVRELLLRNGRRAWRSLELVRAHLIVTGSLGDPLMTGAAAGLIAAANPRFEMWRGKLLFEFVPDFEGRLFAEGEVAVQTRPIVWIVIVLDVLCSPATWRARRVWRERSAPPPRPQRPPSAR